MPTRIATLLLLIALLSGCAVFGERLSASCAKGSFDCGVFEFAAASEKTLRSHGATVSVDCPWHFYAPPHEQIMPECKVLISAVLDHVNGKFRDCLQPIRPDDVVFSESGGALDSFVPGQEFADEYSNIVATIPLAWVEPGRCRR